MMKLKLQNYLTGILLILLKNSKENSLSEVQISIAKYRNHSSIITIAEKTKNLVTVQLASISLRMRKQ